MGTPSPECDQRSFWFCWRLLPLHRLKHSRMLLRPLRLMLMLFCITPTITTATMDSHGMSLDARGVMLKLKLPLMLMPMLMLVSCTAFTTLTLTTATMDSPGMCLDARGVKLKLPPMLMPVLMLVCIGITTLTSTTATMDSPGMCLDARGVMLKLRQRLMLMPDIMDTILIMAMEDTMATILDKQCVWRKILYDTLNSLSTTSNSTFFL